MEVAQVAAASGGKLRVFDFAFGLTKSYTFWSGLLGGTFLTMASHGTDQTMVQRLLAARNERDSKKALLGSGVVVFAQFALLLVLGVMLFVFAQRTGLPAPADTDRIFPEFIVREMPVGLTGLVLASIIAVAMSNASGSLNSLASSSMIDFGKGSSAADASPKGSDGSGSRQLNRSRRMTLVWGAVLGLLGLVRWGGVLEAGLTIASVTYGGMLGVFLLGSWNRRANETGALIGFATGIAAMIAVRFCTPLAFTWYVLAGTIITFAVGSLASLATARTD
jgi:Na+/proline symporter